MSLPAFIDIDEVEQAKELRNYFISLGAEISAETSENGVHEDIASVLEVSNLLWKSADEGEIEGIFNSILCLLLIQSPDKMESLVGTMCEKIVNVEDSDSKLQTRMRIMNNLFYGLEERNPLRAEVYCSVLQLAAQNKSVEDVPTSLDTVKKWFKYWTLPLEKRQKILRILHQTLLECQQSESASLVMVELLGMYTSQTAGQATQDARHCIASSLRDPHTYVFDHLLALTPVKHLQGKPIHQLLMIFINGKLDSYLKFYNANQEFIESLGMSHQDNLNKMQILSFMSLASAQKEITFDLIQRELDMDADEVEFFILEAIRSKMVFAKIDQMQKKVIVSYSVQRSFGVSEWQQLRDNLDSWQSNLGQVQEHLQSIAT